MVGLGLLFLISFGSFDLLSPRWVDAADPNSNTLNGRNLRLVFEDTFGSGNVETSKWDYDVSMWGGGNGEFQIYTNSKTNTFVRNGALHLKPTLTADTYGEPFLRTGVFDVRKMFGYCTQDSNNGCFREGKNGLLPVIMSGRLKSKAEIRYGKVEIVAKLPRGDWIWPALWMLPRHNKYGTWPRSGEIDIMETIGNAHHGGKGVDICLSTLHWGSDWQNNRFHQTAKSRKASSGTYADRFYKYTLLWDKSGIEVFVDNDQVARFATPGQGYWRFGNLPGNSPWQGDGPFDQPFYLLMNVAVGGTNGFFSDGGNKPWSNGSGGRAMSDFWNAKGRWYPTWQGDNAALQIKSVRMYQLE